MFAQYVAAGCCGRLAPESNKLATTSECLRTRKLGGMHHATWRKRPDDRRIFRNPIQIFSPDQADLVAGALQCMNDFETVCRSSRSHLISESNISRMFASNLKSWDIRSRCSKLKAFEHVSPAGMDYTGKTRMESGENWPTIRSFGFIWYILIGFGLVTFSQFFRPSGVILIPSTKCDFARDARVHPAICHKTPMPSLGLRNGVQNLAPHVT